jgi:ComF family protein
LRNAIHRLKYEGDMSLADILAQPILRLLLKQDWEVGLVIPVPMGSSRRVERGYNQAALLAIPLALGSGVPYRSKALTKLRDTRSQVGLSIAQRRENVAGAFVASERLVGGKRVLVVDDVMTSGATLESCARALKEAGAEIVYGLTLARAGFGSTPEFLDTDV